MVELPTSVAELLTFKLGYETKDAAGNTYHVFTSFEGMGGCWWCGAELHGRQKRYCREGYGTDEVHSRLYWRHFNWQSARNWCIQRYEYKCANCGEKWGGLEAHHIIPLDGGGRAWSIFNLPWNLIAFCHECHQEIHAVMRGASRPVPADIFDQALERGQQMFAMLR